jgi:peptide alpha-N-acetyltransferase
MQKVYEAKYCSLHVRKTNKAAYGLYADVLNYETNSITENYYADGEDAYDMRFYFDEKDRDNFRIKRAKRIAKEEKDKIANAGALEK